MSDLTLQVCVHKVLCPVSLPLVTSCWYATDISVASRDDFGCSRVLRGCYSLALRVRFFGRLADQLGVRALEVPERVPTAQELFRYLGKVLGEKARLIFNEDYSLRAGILVVVDGQPLSMIGGINAKLEGGETVYFDTIDIYEVEGGG